MGMARIPSKFYKPLAAGAPTPFIEKPVRLERMIHFVAPQVEKIRAKMPELIRQVDVICGNLEDAIPAADKEAARAGFIELARANEFGRTGLWTRVNALNSPWVLEDILEIMAAVGDKLDVLMLPKVEGPWDIHYLDQLLAQLEARHGIKRTRCRKPHRRPRAARSPVRPARPQARPAPSAECRVSHRCEGARDRRPLGSSALQSISGPSSNIDPRNRSSGNGRAPTSAPPACASAGRLRAAIRAATSARPFSRK